MQESDRARVNNPDYIFANPGFGNNSATFSGLVGRGAGIQGYAARSRVGTASDVRSNASRPKSQYGNASASGRRLTEARLVDMKTNGKHGRFNEKIDTKSVRSSQRLSRANLATLDRKGDMGSQAGSQVVRSARARSAVSAHSRASQSKTAAESHRRKILNMVSQMNDQELQKMSDMVEPKEELEDKVEEVYVNDEDLVVEDTRPPVEIPPKNFMAHTQPEYMTSVSQQTASKSFISNLQRQLDDEREARGKLEEELKVLKDLSHEIQAHLKANPNAQIL